jgi:hypothetical protein
MNIEIENLVYAGSFYVDSGQAIIGDPCYLDEYDTCVDQEWELEGKEGIYSYQGISATTLALHAGEIGNGKAVAFNTGYGDGVYPVFIKLNDEGIISKVVIDFEATGLEMDLDE